VIIHVRVLGAAFALVQPGSQRHPLAVPRLMKGSSRLVFLFALLFTLIFAQASASSSVQPPVQASVQLGLERLMEDPAVLRGKRVAVICNATSIDSHFRHVVDLLHTHPEIQLTAILAPEHGFRGTIQAGVSVPGEVDSVTGVRIFSLYGDTRHPTPEMLQDADAIVFDVQDVGTRFYTYISTMQYAMQVAQEHGKTFVVLDRPNPLGGVRVEGPVLEPTFASFVGVDVIPVRHGMTVGELARFMNRSVGADLHVVPMSGWQRDMLFTQTGLQTWVMPSPNMPTPDTALVYPGTGLLEGTNVSEGRGTTRPFELLGAPFIEPHAFAAHLNAKGLPGVVFRPVTFQPTFSKYAGQNIGGVQVHIVDAAVFDSIVTGLEILASARERYPGAFAIDRPQHFDLLAGNSWVREALTRGDSVQSIMIRWQEGLDQFMRRRQEYLLYD
jgi:uncharacterized protein YbbC (DUF1343 family)